MFDQLLPDVMRWGQTHQIVWKSVLKKWITSMATMMSKQSVNRIWSILFFEGYGSLFPLILSIISSNKHLLLSLPSSTDCQKYLEMDFLPAVRNVGDITKNFRVLIAPNQPSSRFFDITHIRSLRVQFLDAYVKELQTVNLSTKRKAELIESQMNDCEKYRNALDNYLRDIHSQIDSIRGMDQ